MSVQVRVPATSANLGAGFDTLGVALSRYMRVTATAGEIGDDGVRVATPALVGKVPTGDDNLVWTSLLAFCEHHDVAPPEVTLQVDTDIPLARGLGSSSAAIVAGLLLGRELTDVDASTDDLVALATSMEGHPDNVAPALLGGFVAGAEAIDGTTIVRRAVPTPALTTVVAIPEVEQLTSHARAMVPDQLASAYVIEQAGRAAHLVGAILGSWPPDVRLCGDLLHEPPRLARMDVTRAVLIAWRDAGVFSWLSGAGPSAAALVESSGDAVATASGIASDVLAGFDVAADGHEVVVLDWDLSGATVLSS